MLSQLLSCVRVVCLPSLIMYSYQLALLSGIGKQDNAQKEDTRGDAAQTFPHQLSVTSDFASTCYGQYFLHCVPTDLNLNISFKKF